MSLEEGQVWTIEAQMMASPNLGTKGQHQEESSQHFRPQIRCSLTQIEKRVRLLVAVIRPRAVFSKEWLALPGEHPSAAKHL